MTDEELIAYLHLQGLDKDIAAADRIEALVKQVDTMLTPEEAEKLVEMADPILSELLAVEASCRKEAEARAERLEAALHNCVGMLDQLVAESGRDIEWGAEDPFRMGEWFEPEDLAQIKQARTALKGDDHE